VKIVIFGLGRTGTSALFYKIKEALPRNTVCLFEPKTSKAPRVWLQSAALTARFGTRPHWLAKVLPFGEQVTADAAGFEHFDKQILTVRDPRDQMISLVLYQIYDVQADCREAMARVMLSALRAKEASPRAVPFLHLVDAYNSLSGSADRRSWLDRYKMHAVDTPMQFHAKRVALHLFSYDDLMAKRFDGLADYLGVPIANTSPEVDKGVRRVARTRGSGSWRHWFTPEDVQQLRPVLQPYLDQYFPGSDWTLDPDPVVNPAHSSLYVERLLAERTRATR
jgi:hypothetical protein